MNDRIPPWMGAGMAMALDTPVPRSAARRFFVIAPEEGRDARKSFLVFTASCPLTPWMVHFVVQAPARERFFTRTYKSYSVVTRDDSKSDYP